MPAQRRAAAAEPAEAPASGPRVLKKYPNRRLYDTRSSLHHAGRRQGDGARQLEDFEVRDAKTGEDLTRSILLQIILEEETGGVPMFSPQMLAQIIRFYGHAMQGMMGAYLEKNLQTFVDLQTRFAEQGKGLYDPRPSRPRCGRSSSSGQAPTMQGLMGNYLEQSKNLFAQMQEQMAKQAGTLFPGIPGSARQQALSSRAWAAARCGTIRRMSSNAPPAEPPRRRSASSRSAARRR